MCSILPFYNTSSMIFLVPMWSIIYVVSSKVWFELLVQQTYYVINISKKFV